MIRYLYMILKKGSA